MNEEATSSCSAAAPAEGLRRVPPKQPRGSAGWPATLLSAGLWLSGTSTLLACAPDDDEPPLPTPTAGTPPMPMPMLSPGGTEPGSTTVEEPSVYALLTLVWSDDGPTGYVSLSNTVERSNVSLEGAREVPGVVYQWLQVK